MKRIKEWFKARCCGWLQWHSTFVGYDDDRIDGIRYAKCKWCGYEGLVDSQGNLF